MENIVSSRKVNFRDFLVYRFADRDLAKENDHLARLAVQLMDDREFPVDLYSKLPNRGWGVPTQYGSLLRYCHKHPAYEWCIYPGNPVVKPVTLFIPEIELAWIEYDAWLSSLTEA